MITFFSLRRNVSRQFFVTVIDQTPFRSPVSWWSPKFGGVANSSKASAALMNASILRRRSASPTKPLAFPVSKKRRKPLWLMLSISIPPSDGKRQKCQLSRCTCHLAGRFPFVLPRLYRDRPAPPPFVPESKPMSRPVPPASNYNSYITAGDNLPDRGGHRANRNFLLEPNPPSFSPPGYGFKLNCAGRVPGRGVGSGDKSP